MPPLANGACLRAWHAVPRAGGSAPHGATRRMAARRTWSSRTAASAPSLTARRTRRASSSTTPLRGIGRREGGRVAHSQAWQAGVGRLTVSEAALPVESRHRLFAAMAWCERHGVQGPCHGCPAPCAPPHCARRRQYGRGCLDQFTFDRTSKGRASSPSRRRHARSSFDRPIREARVRTERMEEGLDRRGRGRAGFAQESLGASLAVSCENWCSRRFLIVPVRSGSRLSPKPELHEANEAHRDRATRAHIAQ